MQFIRPKLILHVFILAFSLIWGAGIFASGGGAEGEKKEGESTAAPVSKEKKEFIEKSSKLTALSNRIEEYEKQFHELIKKKSIAKTPEAKQEIIKQMVELTNTRNKDVESYNKLKADLSYRYPNEGGAIERRYQTQSKRSVEELEGAAGLDELLTRTKKVVDKKFAPFMPAEELEKKPATHAQPESEDRPHLRLEK